GAEGGGRGGGNGTRTPWRTPGCTCQLPDGGGMVAAGQTHPPVDPLPLARRERLEQLGEHRGLLAALEGERRIRGRFVPQQVRELDVFEARRGRIQRADRRERRDQLVDRVGRETELRRELLARRVASEPPGELVLD